MKKNYGKNKATYILANSEKKNILETYNILEKLVTALYDSACVFDPQDGEIFRVRINGDEVLPLDELEDFVNMMEKIITVDSVSCCLEDEYDCD